MFRTIPGLYPPDTSSTPPSRPLPPDIAKRFLGGGCKIATVKNQYSRLNFCISLALVLCPPNSHWIQHNWMFLFAPWGLNCSWQGEKKKDKETRYSRNAVIWESCEHHYFLILDFSKLKLRGRGTHPPHSKSTCTFEVCFSFRGFCYSKFIFCFVLSKVFSFGKVNAQFSH